MVIAKTASTTSSRNAAFKVARMREPVMEDQDEFIIRRSGAEEVVGLEANNIRAALEDIGHNAHLYISPIKRARRKIRY